MSFASLFQPVKTVKWHEFFDIKITEEPIILFQIEPDRTIHNGRNLEGIVNGYYALQRSFLKRIRKEDKEIVVSLRNHVSHEIYYEKDKVTFNITCPISYGSFMQRKIEEAFPRSTIRKIQLANDHVKNFTENARYVKLIQEEHYFKSLAGDLRENAPIPSLVNVVTGLQGDDKALLQFIFNPIDESWKRNAADTWTKYRKGEKVEKSASMATGFFDSVFSFIDKAFEILDMVAGANIDNKKQDVKLLRRMQKLSSATTQKTNFDGFDVHVRILSESKDTVRAEQTAKSIITALKDISEDNELIPQKNIKKINTKTLKQVQERRIPIINLSKNIWSSKEVAQVIQLPNAKIQEDYQGIISSIQTKEVNLPTGLTAGTIPLGSTKYLGKGYTVYWDSNNLDYFALPKLWQGFSRSGKTTAGMNFIRETQVNGFYNLVIDVNDGKLVDDVVNALPSNYPEDKVKILDFTNPEYIFRLGFNECLRLAKIGVGNKQADRAFSKVADTLSYFLNAINLEPLSDRMMRYFVSAMRICLFNGYCGVGAFRKCLTEHQFRNDLCKKSEGKIRDKILHDMLELNDCDKYGNITGTKSLVSGIIDRLDKLIQTDVLEDCFMDEPNADIDFRKWFDEGYFIGIKANKDAVGGFETCNILITFIIQKAWSAILSRYDDINNQNKWRLGFITMDEPHSFPLVCKILTGAIRESPKWRCGFNFMVHDLDDLGVMLPKLIDAGGNFVLFNTSEKNYKKVETIMKPFTIEEALDTKQYHALHIINYRGERVVFDAKTLLPPNERYPVINRQHITKYCWRKHGN